MATSKIPVSSSSSTSTPVGAKENGRGGDVAQRKAEAQLRNLQSNTLPHSSSCPTFSSLPKPLPNPFGSTTSTFSPFAAQTIKNSGEEGDKGEGMARAIDEDKERERRSEREVHRTSRSSSSRVGEGEAASSGETEGVPRQPSHPDHLGRHHQSFSNLGGWYEGIQEGIRQGDQQLSGWSSAALLIAGIAGFCLGAYAAPHLPSLLKRVTIR